MKNLFKKISAILIAAVMVLAMASTAFADGENGLSAEIIINNAEHATFSYLQVIKPNSQKETGWDFASTDIAMKYKTAFNLPDEQTIIKKMLVLQNADSKYASEVSAATTQEIENALEAVLAVAADPDDTTITWDAAGVTAPITVHEAGVYAIKGTETDYAYSAMGASISFNENYDMDGKPIALNNATINAKKTPTTITKVSTDEDKVVEIGRDVTYTVTGTVPYLPSTQNRYYRMKDTITGAVYKVETAEGANKGKLAVTVTVGTNNPETLYVKVENNSFVLDLDKYVPLANTYANQQITLTYEATVTDVKVNNTIKAGDGSDWNKPQYGSDDEELFTGKIVMTKYDEKGKEGGKTLSDAGFKVYKEVTDENNNKVKHFAKFDGNMKFAGWTTDEAEATEITTGTNGTVTINGLDLGTYKFKEVTAPNGYSLNTADEAGKLELKAGETTATAIVEGTAAMSDTKLGSLPSTGGMGTYLFTIIGVVVMAGAAGAFFISRRKGSEE